MQLILNVPTLPGGEDQAFKFGVALEACKAAGAFCLHAETSMRRWEQYDSLEAFRKDFQRVQNSVAIAEPMLRKYKIKLAIENHKDWRARSRRRGSNGWTANGWACASTSATTLRCAKIPWTR